MVRRLLTIGLLLALLSYPAIGLVWSEIMFNPSGNDNGKEFVELLGNESLDKCIIRDSASADTLELLSEGSDIILIIESNSSIAVGNATAYLAGSAIGNGLGNTADSLRITCGETLMLETAYNISAFEGYKEGYSIVFNDSWALGNPNGTPGVIEKTQEDTVTSSAASSSGGDRKTCEDTLLLSANITSGSAGDLVKIAIESPGYAWFEVNADKLPVASGDTLTTRTHIITLPAAKQLKITAYAAECGAKQRAVRYITIVPAAVQNTEINTEINESGEERKTAADGQKDVIIEAETEMLPPTPELPLSEESQAVPEVTGAAVGSTDGTVIAQDLDAVPWISAFGIVTVIASAAVFLQLLRRGDA